MMDTKIPVYTVFAVVLGVLLTYAVPSALTPQRFAMRGEAPDEDSPPVMAPGVEEATEAFSSGESLGAPDKDVQNQGGVNQFSKYSLLFVDLIIALGVYMIARRRLV